jgi:hypothetical protein
MLMTPHRRHPAGRDTAHLPANTVTSTISIIFHDRTPGTNGLGRSDKMV